MTSDQGVVGLLQIILFILLELGGAVGRYFKRLLTPVVRVAKYTLLGLARLLLVMIPSALGALLLVGTCNLVIFLAGENLFLIGLATVTIIFVLVMCYQLGKETY
jgi:hypothetical protein